jgi:conjugative transfer signal peptidase TraF
MYRLRAIKHKYPLYIIVGFLVLYFVSNFIDAKKFFYINSTASEPIGIYWVVPPATIQKGDYVIFSIPREAEQYVYGRSWAPIGMPLLKNVGAIEGDRYTLTEDAFSINGQRIGPIAVEDSEGLPLPHLGKGEHVVAGGKFLATSSYNDRSFDSRYMGEIPIENIKAKVVPVWTW